MALSSAQILLLRRKKKKKSGNGECGTLSCGTNAPQTLRATFLSQSGSDVSNSQPPSSEADKQQQLSTEADLGND